MSPQFSVSRDDVDAVAAWTVIRAGRELARRLATELAPLDLNPIEFGALIQLATATQLSQAELARAVGVTPQSMSAIVSGLEGRRLLQRGAEPGRGRLSRLRLTPAGSELLSRAYPIVRASNAWFDEAARDAGAPAEPASPGGSGTPATSGSDAISAALRPLLND